MKCSISKVKGCMPLLLPAVCLLCFSTFSLAQGTRMEKGERATCMVTTNSSSNNNFRKTSPGTANVQEANQFGVFRQVSNIGPAEQVSLQVHYPSGKTGQKVVVIVLDGGKLDNGKGIKQVVLDKNMQCVFDFQTTGSAGLYRLFLRKGSDAKIIQLWVGKPL